ncbi:tyrosinase family protein [Ensifer aridi]|uniref:tyrosinase family protein n=1 Tax=Ensifer aridi TaxID=1708715 RepID=UPI00358E7AEF
MDRGSAVNNLDGSYVSVCASGGSRAKDKLLAFLSISREGARDMLHLHSRRSFFKVVSGVTVAITSGLGTARLAFADAPATSIRKSIDALTADELELYLFALSKLMERSKDDPSIPFSFAFYADIHNGNPGCEHWKHQFFPWHRAMLSHFEEGLRSTDPSTRNVTVPYWDWTRPPSGKRYPVAFENDPAAVAAKYGRAIDTQLLAVMFDDERVDHNQSPTTDPAFEWSFVSKLASVDGYENFAGTVWPNGGQTEHDVHDVMHSTYVSGKMGSTATAALDPLFWSFHAFIDLIWWWRQQRKTDTVTCSECTDETTCEPCSLQGMPNKLASGLEGPTLVAEVVDAKGQLGYVYEHAEPATPPAVAAADVKYVDRSPVLAALATQEPADIIGFDVDGLAGGNDLSISLENVSLPRRVPYTALIYLHPAEQPFKPADSEFRDRFLVGHYALWVNTHAHHEAPSMLRDIEFVVPKLAIDRIGAPGGSKMRVSVAIYIAKTPKMEATLLQEAITSEVKIGGVTVKNR